MFVKLCALIMSILASFASMKTALPEVEPMNVTPDGSFVPVMRFVVSSDSHIKEYGDTGCQRIMKMINTGYALAEADENYGKLDAAVMVGDITDFGKPSSFAALNESVKKVLKDDTDFLGVAAKNHDSYLGRISRSYVSAVSGDCADFHKVINGYHFIGLSASPDVILHYSALQIKWLDKQLKAATEADPDKPVFVFQHEHIKDTVYGSLPEDGWGVDKLTDTLKKYPQVIDISGHSHYPANDPRSIWQGEFTAINDGGLNYYEFTIDGKNSQHPESSSNMAHMLIVEVDAANRVKIRVCDMNADAVLTEYLIEDLAEPVKTKYAPDTRKAEAAAPVFDKLPEISTDGQNVTLTVHPAVPSENDVVFIYRVNITDEDGNTVSTLKKLGDYYKNPVAEDVILRTELPAGEYTAVVTAEDAWGYTSDSVNIGFTVE